MKRAQTGISISQDAMNLLDMVAEKLGVNRSAVIELIVRFYVAHSQDFDLKQ